MLRCYLLVSHPLQRISYQALKTGRGNDKNKSGLMAMILKMIACMIGSWAVLLLYFLLTKTSNSDDISEVQNNHASASDIFFVFPLIRPFSSSASDHHNPKLAESRSTPGTRGSPDGAGTIDGGLFSPA
jgi:hypothetical protein